LVNAKARFTRPRYFSIPAAMAEMGQLEPAAARSRIGSSAPKAVILRHDIDGLG
jgi:hypothetical protein